MNSRKFFAEGLGTALLVFVGVGVATLSFGFKLTGSSMVAGVMATALAFGLAMLILAHAVGPASGAHVNPAVTMGFLVARRISGTEAIGYWIAQLIGGVVGAGLLRLMFAGAKNYAVTTIGLGTNGFGAQSMIHLGAQGAFLAEVVLTFLFVLVVLCVTSKAASTLLAGVAIGLALATVHLLGVPLTGTSVNPARSIGPALFVGGAALSQLWLFIVAPMLGGTLAAWVSNFLYPREHPTATTAPSEQKTPHLAG